MKLKITHNWQLNHEQAVELQQQLARVVIKVDYFTSIKTVCGVDVGFKDDYARACAVVMNLDPIRIIDRYIEESKITMPYIPGLLSFREIPALIPVLDRLSIQPDLLIADGQGLAHPRSLGLATHLGIIYDIPTIGCAKSRLIGEFREPGLQKGSYSDLYHKEEIVGTVLRTKVKTKPVFVSIGHKISLKSAVKYILKLTTKYRLPEPIRYAHQGASKID